MRKIVIRSIKSLLCIGMASVVMQAIAYDQQGKVFVAGTTSCGQMTDDLKKNEINSVAYENFLQGFVTGINISIPGKANFFEGTDSISRFKFVAKFCEENPLSSTANAYHAMVKKITGRDVRDLSATSQRVK